MSLKPFLPLLAGLALSGCAIGDRSIQTPHKIQVAGDTAVVPGCPDWSDGEVNSGEGQSTNYGCATRLNLAAMIADPADLVHGQVATATDAIATVRAIKAYREQIPTGTKELEKVKASGGGQ